jgi:sec-independent protein translocase protein TatA
MILGNIFGGDGLIVVIIALVVIFGGSQLPKIARNVGSAGKEFRKAQAEAEAETRAEEVAKVVPPAPVAVPVVPAATPAPQASSDSVTLSKADLEALLDERARRASESN